VYGDPTPEAAHTPHPTPEKSGPNAGKKEAKGVGVYGDVPSNPITARSESLGGGNGFTLHHPTPYTPVDNQEQNTSEEDIEPGVAPSRGLTGAYGQVVSSKAKTEALLRRKLQSEGIPTFENHGKFLDDFERMNPDRRTGYSMLERVVEAMGGEIL
jgi:hypothetical protein